MNAPVNFEKSETAYKPDMKALCRRENVKYFKYEDEDGRVAYMLHEQKLETGLKFYNYNEMVDALVNFSVFRRVPRNRHCGLVEWGGRRGYRVVTTMSEEAIKRREQKRAEEAAKLAKTGVTASV